MQCPRCHQENRAEARFCEDCGAPLAVKCPSCGAALTGGKKFCGTCGQSVIEQAVPLASSAQSARVPEAERRQITVMFCDLAGSTTLSERLDPEELRDLVRAYQQACSEVVQKFEGHIAQYLGDGVLVYFGYPLAHEDDAERAVRAGLGIVDRLQALTTGAGTEQLRLAARVGIHTGLVVAGEVGGGEKREQLALGDAPNIAARLQALAEANTVVISGVTARLVQGLFLLQDLGRQPLKGVSAPVAVFQVLRESGAQSRLDVVGTTALTPLVGRQQEIGLLLDRWERASEGDGQLVLLTGEPGIGKSRLVQVAKDRVAAPHSRLECRCSPYYQHTPLYPLIDLLPRFSEWNRDDPTETKYDKLEQGLGKYAVALTEVMPLLAALLSLPPSDRYPLPPMSPERQKQRTLEEVLGIVLTIAATQPALFIVEDLHWTDPTTLEFVTLLLDQIPTARLLVLLTARPTFSSPWAARSHLTQVTLTRFTQKQTAAMVSGVTRGKSLPPQVAEQIIAKTDGVPLFVEELTKMVLESGLITAKDDGYVLTAPLRPLAIPSTLQDSLMARLDRLSAAKEVAQLGATLGRAFPYDLIRAVSPLDDEDLRSALDRLVAAELLYQRGLPPNTTYTFKHALVQEAAYQSLLKSTRQQYHQRIATVLIQRFPHIAETQPELVAHHYTEAGLYAEAVGYWQRAGRRATERSALTEAASHYTKALTVLEKLPDTDARVAQELLLQTTLGWAIMAGKGWTVPEAERAFTRALELGQRTSANRELLPALHGLSVFFKMAASYDKADAVARQSLSIAEPMGDHEAIAWSRYQIGSVDFRRGNLPSARLNLEAALNAYRPGENGPTTTYLPGQDSKLCALADLSAVLWLLGYPDTAVRRSEETLAHARALHKPYALCYALNADARLHLLRQDWPSARQAAEPELAIAEEQGFRFWAAMAKGYRGVALAHQEEIAEGIRMVNTCIEELRPGGVGAAGVTQWFVFLSGVHLTLANADAAMDWLVQAARQIEMMEERTYEAELHRLQGELALLRDPEAFPKAEAAFLQALEVARRQEARSFELRAATSLSRLWRRQGKRDEARRLLVEVYGWFTEGRDTPDLKEAKALLERLV